MRDASPALSPPNASLADLPPVCRRTTSRRSDARRWASPLGGIKVLGLARTGAASAFSAGAACGAPGAGRRGALARAKRPWPLQAARRVGKQARVRLSRRWCRARLPGRGAAGGRRRACATAFSLARGWQVWASASPASGPRGRRAEAAALQVVGALGQVLRLGVADGRSGRLGLRAAAFSGWPRRAGWALRDVGAAAGR